MSPLTASESLLQRIRGEFNESPGLRLTPWQFQQLWALTADESRVMMQRLLNAGFLREAPDGTLVRNDERIRAPRPTRLWKWFGRRHAATPGAQALPASAASSRPHVQRHEDRG